MSLEFTDGDGAQALDQQQEIDRWQFSVIEGCAVSPGTDDMTVQVEAGSIFFDGDAVDVVAQDNVQLAAADSTYPRKDVVYLDANGDLQVEKGTAESAVPADSTRFQTRRPAPSDLSGAAATVLAEVWVAAGGADISTGDVRDRRVFAEISTGSVSLADQDTQPSAAAGGRVIYAKASDGSIYKVNPDGTEEEIGSGAFSDDDGDGTYILPNTSDGIDVASVSTGEVFNRGVTTGVVTNANPRSEAAKSLPEFPTNWTKHDGNPIISGNTTTLDQAAFCSFFNAGEYLSAPIDEYYLYWAGHDGGGIWLHTAPDPLGPWTEYGQVFDVSDTTLGDHASSPDAVWDGENGRLNLYIHGKDTGTSPETQKTTLMTNTGTDGTSFTEQGDVLIPQLDGSWDEQERSYMSVRKAGGLWIGLYNGRDDENNNKGLGYAWSHDGSAGSWQTLSHPLFKNQHLIKDPDVTYDPRADQQGPGGNLVQFGGQLWVLLYYGNSTTDRAVKAVRFDSLEQTTAPSYDVIEATETWEADSLEIGDIVYIDDRLYLYYNSYDSSTDERQIGVAYADLGGY